MQKTFKTKTISFGEQDEGFIKKLAKDIGCHYSKANERTYNLNKFESEVNSEMGVFAWVHKQEDDCFWVSTRKIWVDEVKAKVSAGKKAPGINYFPKDNQISDDSVNFNTQDDYPKTVNALKLINKMR
jgi:hypothetical protein